MDECRRTALADEAKRGVVADPDTRPLDPSGSSMDPEPRTTPGGDQRPTSRPLEPVDDENVSEKARVARNVLQIRCEDSVEFDVNEEAWPDVELVIGSSYQGALIDGLSTDKVNAGDG